MRFDKFTSTVIGATKATFVASRLVAESVYFEFMPMPDDYYSFTVRLDRKGTLLQLVELMRLKYSGDDMYYPPYSIVEEAR